MTGLVGIIKTLIHQGLERFGRYYSSYRGFVISNEDPDSFNRLQLKVPNVYGQEVMIYWAHPKNNFSGQGYGCQVLPQIKDMVWVEFELGDPRRPIWSHGHFGELRGKGHDIKEEKLKKVKNYWFKTPDGHLVELDDETGEVRITHKSGTDLLTFKEGEIFFNDGSNNGLVKVADMVSKFNTLENKWNNFIIQYNTHVHVSAAPASNTTPPVGAPQTSVPVTTQPEVENTLVKH